MNYYLILQSTVILYKVNNWVFEQYILSNPYQTYAGSLQDAILQDIILFIPRVCTEISILYCVGPR